MRKRKNQRTQMTHYLNNIEESNQIISKSTGEIVKKLSNVEHNRGCKKSCVYGKRNPLI